MKVHTGISQIFIFFRCHRNTRIQVQHSHLRKKTFQGTVESSACTAASSIMFHIDGHFGAPPISSSWMKGRAIGITQDFSVLFCHNIWIFFFYVMNSFRKFLCGRCFIFKCDRRFFYIVGINLYQCCRIFFFCHTYLHCFITPLLFFVSSLFHPETVNSL